MDKEKVYKNIYIMINDGLFLEKYMELTENTFARMNFRFEENIYTEEGKTTKAINDWGGKYQYRDTYE